MLPANRGNQAIAINTHSDTSSTPRCYCKGGSENQRSYIYIYCTYSAKKEWERTQFPFTKTWSKHGVLLNLSATSVTLLVGGGARLQHTPQNPALISS